MTNNVDSTPRFYTADNAVNNIITIPSPNNYTNVEFKINVHTQGGACSPEVVRVITVKTPRFNERAGFSICNEARDFYLCQESMMSDYEVTDFEFTRLVSEHIDRKTTEAEKEAEANNKSFFGQILDFIVEYWVFITAGGVIVAGITVAAIVVWRRKRVI